MPDLTTDRNALWQRQLKRLRGMLSPVLNSNAFYRDKLNRAGIYRPEDIQTRDDYRRLPFTTKAELSADQAARPPYGSNLTFPPESLYPRASNIGDYGRAFGLVGYGRELGLVCALLDLCVSRGGRDGK